MDFHPSATSVLFIDDHISQRADWADQLKQCSQDYEILEASDAQSGLELCRSRKIDCVVLELDLPGRSGFELLVELVPLASRPTRAVIVLTKISHRAVWDLAMDSVAYACFYKQHTTGKDLDKAIQRAVSLIGQMPKEDRYRPL